MEMGKPPLDERGRGGQQQVRCADRGQQNEQGPGNGGIRARRLQSIAGCDRENDQGQPQQDRVQESLTAPRQPTHDEVRVGVSTQQHQLEKHQRRRPDARCRAEPRKDVLADDRLHLEQQKRAQEHRGGKECHRASRPGPSLPVERTCCDAHSRTVACRAAGAQRGCDAARRARAEGHIAADPWRPQP